MWIQFSYFIPINHDNPLYKKFHEVADSNADKMTSDWSIFKSSQPFETIDCLQLSIFSVSKVSLHWKCDKTIVVMFDRKIKFNVTNFHKVI